jgi:3'-phosphoadenosine 5'-phosphosulfate sulfotransferase (PAPS reductase)/FAD synthetase
MTAGDLVMLKLPANVAALVAQNALFVVNHSGGKDSQAMMIEVLKVIPRDQIIVVHASLGDVEWKGALELAEKQAADAGVPFLVARAAKSFLDMVETRFATRPGVPSFPSSKNRQCNSDLKRDPIAKVLRAYVAKSGHSVIVNCVGVRAAESSSRSKAPTWKQCNRMTTQARTVYEWLPIHTMSTADVFATIAAAGQEPHYAYALGNQRLSCVFCIMGSKNDLALGAKHNPELFARYVELEERTGYTMHMSRKSLTELVADAADFAIAA